MAARRTYRAEKTHARHQHTAYYSSEHADSLPRVRQAKFYGCGSGSDGIYGGGLYSMHACESTKSFCWLVAQIVQLYIRS